MNENTVLTRDNIPTEELQRTTIRVFKGEELSYQEVYYLDFEVNEETGTINRNNKVQYYTKNQVARNLRALKSAYFVTKGAVVPSDIISFRTKYKISASTLSLILGFSKNTISNIENEGVTSLSSGRFIKMCLSDNLILKYYLTICDALGTVTKQELSERLDNVSNERDGEITPS